MDQENNPFDKIISLKVGEAHTYADLEITLVSVELYPHDHTGKAVKSAVHLEISKAGQRESLTIGEYAENSRIAHQHLFSVKSTDKNSASISVDPFHIFLDAGDISPSYKNIELIFNHPLSIDGLNIILKDLTHVNAYGSYFTMDFVVGDSTDSRVYRQGGSFNFKNYFFSLTAPDLSQAKLTIRRLRLGDEFVIQKGKNIFLPSEDLRIELLEQADNQKDRVEYLFKLSKGDKTTTTKITQIYTIPENINIPDGKFFAPSKLFDRKNSHLVIPFEGFTLESVIRFDEMNENTTNHFKVQKK
ncbi:MAG: hypothetical protein IT395_05510 [Candidatus Omnitrophica bacterium]|nr:hypothetical protein [Candidatus Omnitrophota bacterium]